MYMRIKLGKEKKGTFSIYVFLGMEKVINYSDKKPKRASFKNKKKAKKSL